MKTNLKDQRASSSYLSKQNEDRAGGGALPEICQTLLKVIQSQQGFRSVLPCVPVLQQLPGLDQETLARIVHHPGTSHVLMENSLLKVVLIHWPPGKRSSIHGHPDGGCIFKVLHGSVEEFRYSTGVQSRLLAVSKYRAGSLAYIDDHIGLHAVGNPHNIPAITLHVYAYGMQMTAAA